jgi:hypothetical protein
MGVYTVNVCRCEDCGHVWICNGLLRLIQAMAIENEPRFSEKARDWRCEKCGSVRWNNPKLATVYVIKDETGRYFKIGWSVEVSKRVSDISLQMPFKIDPVPVLVSREMRPALAVKLEHHLHKTFAAAKLNGEWYSLGADDIAAIKREMDEFQG